MTLWALLSDVHGRGDRLARALNDIQLHRAEHILALGDIGSPGTLTSLDYAGAWCVFGNWEASGLRGLPAPYRAWVTRWPPVTHHDGFCAAHASPEWPDNLTIAGVVEHLRSNGLHWTHLFPSIHHSESARVAAFAALQNAGLKVFFHGHTHVQEAWRLGDGANLERITAATCAQGELVLDQAYSWLVGVGSVGDPHDGAGICYALYDTSSCRLTWRRI